MARPAVCAVYRNGQRIEDSTIETCGAQVREGQFVWVGLVEPDEATLRRLQAQFGLHELAIEDALHAHQRPKLERYGDGLFLVLRTAQREQGRVVLGESHLFAGKGYVITVRHGPSASYARVRSQCESTPALLEHGEDYVIYAVMDFVIDTYIPILDEIEQEVEVVEDDVFQSRDRAQDVERIHYLRRDLLRLQRAVAPMVEVCASLERLELPAIDAEMHPYFRDVHDHVLRLNETIASLLNVVSFAFEARQMLVSYRQNDVMKQLAGWAAILAVPTMIAGIYGMNFEYMPELKWHPGYFVVLAGMVAVSLGLYVRFKRTGWL